MVKPKKKSKSSKVIFDPQFGEITLDKLREYKKLLREQGYNLGTLGEQKLVKDNQTLALWVPTLPGQSFDPNPQQIYLFMEVEGTPVMEDVMGQPIDHPEFIFVKYNLPNYIRTLYEMIPIGSPRFDTNFLIDSSEITYANLAHSGPIFKPMTIPVLFGLGFLTSLANFYTQ